MSQYFHSYSDEAQSWIVTNVSPEWRHHVLPQIFETALEAMNFAKNMKKTPKKYLV